MSKLAKLMEHDNIDLRDNIVVETGHGTLPSECECGGFLDFAKVNNRVVLVCRECKLVKELD